MRDIFSVLSGHIHFFPLVALAGLLLAGLNLPVSEDLIIISGALVSQEDESLLFVNLAAIFLGVILSDFFVYFVGNRVRKGTAKIGFFSHLIPQKAMDRMRHYLDKFGIFTFIICRFIPFGVRNTLFFTSGFFGLRFRLFLLYDICAALVSVNTLFFLTYNFGEDMKKPLAIAGIVLFVFLVTGLVSLALRFFIKWRNKHRDNETGA